jgi:hypothetical protein
MHRTFTRWLVLAAAVAAMIGLAGPPALAVSVSPVRPAGPGYVPPVGVRPACPAPARGQATCAALIGTRGAGKATSRTAGAASPAATTPSGYAPANLQAAYGFQSASAGMRQTVAIVNAYDDPTAAADLSTYRSQYGLPPCTSANGCFTKTDENGGSSLPPSQPGWAFPAAEAMDMISAVCPNCHILLVEAASTGITDLGTAENTAVSLGAKFLANTWYTPELTYGSAELAYDTNYFNHPGVAITAPAGDSGYGVTYPAASQYVTAVGGTRLTAASTTIRGWTETAWSGTGAGCSAYEPKPTWQTDTGCTGRTLNDTAAVADPSPPDNSTVAFYDTSTGGWVAGGGTTAAAAIVAAAYALAGAPAPGTYPASNLYQHPSALNDITAGSDGTCSASYLCNAGTGYDGPTGEGTPDYTTGLDNAGAQTGPIYSGLLEKCLDDYNGLTTNSNKVDIWNCNTNTSAQSWTVESDGTVRIGGKCLDVAGAHTANNSVVDLYTCVAGAANQQWRARSNGELVNPVSGRCLDDPGASTTNGTQLDIYDCVTGAANEQWTLPYSTPSSVGPITSGITSSKCITDYGAITTNGNPINIYDCVSGAADQHWTIEPNGTLQVLGKCMGVVGYGTSDGSKIELYSCLGQTNQQWRVLADGELFNPESGKCLDDPGYHTTNNTQLDIWDCLDNTNQIWNLP